MLIEIEVWEIEVREIEGRASETLASGKKTAMLWNITSSSLAVGLTAVVVMGFVFGSVLNAVLGENGFGSPGNAIIFVLGFSGAVYFATTHGVSLYDLHLVAAWGIGGAFALFSVVVLLKAGLARH